MRAFPNLIGGVMKKFFVFLLSVCIILSSKKAEAGNQLFAEEAFLLTGTHLKSTAINQSFTGKDDLTGYPVSSNNRGAIFGAGISADVALFGEASLARVVLIDNIGDEYLIYEVYSLLADKNSFSISNASEETKLLNSVIPVSLRIELVGASFTLKDLSVAASVPYKRNEIKEYQQIIREEQERQKIDLLNTMIKKKGMEWTAGYNSLSSLTYAQKKMMFNKNGMLANLQGFEYHVSGVFELKSNKPVISIPTVRTMIDSFDWRERHGATDSQSPYYDGDSRGTGWDTEIKDQSDPQYCGSCWAHSTLASAEMLANLYYNQHIDMDLAEQDLMECSDACSYGNGCNGGSPSSASEWVVDEGVMEEEAFPYEASNDPECGDSINPIENLRFPDYISVRGSNASDDSLKRFIVHYGPLNVGISSMSHAMSMVGYKEQASSGETVWIFKNSHGINSGDNGYREFKPSSLSDFYLTAYTLPVISKIYDDSDIRCVDLDNDGYYNWGVGPKAATCPDGCNDTADCDDFRPDLGPMLEDGSCEEIPVDIQVQNLPGSEIVYNFNPNPFKRYTTINFNVLNDSKTVIRIYDLAGTVIRTFNVSHNQGALKQIVWDGTSERGELISNGMYICKIEMGNADTKISKSIKLFVSR